MRKDYIAELWAKLKPFVARDFPALGNRLPNNSMGMTAHALNGPYHTGEIDRDQATWVADDIDTDIATHTAIEDAHHARQHDILGSDHTVTGGAALDLIGQSAADTLARITPSSNPGAASAVLKSDSGGGVTVTVAEATTKVRTPLIDTSGSADLTIQPGGDLNLVPFGQVNVTGDVVVTGDMSATGTATISTKVLTPNVDATSDLTLTAGDDIMLDPTGEVRMSDGVTIQSDNYASQLTGWRHTYAGELDTRYIYSDQMKVKLFIADLEQALAGSQVLTKSSTTLSRPFTVPFPGEYNFLYVDDLPSAEGMAVAESGDMVRLREYSRASGSLSVTDVWGVVTEYADQADKEQRWKFTRVSGGATVSTPAMVGSIQTYAAPSSTSAVLTKPTGTSEGHTLYAFFVLDSAAVGVTAPDGTWTLLASDSITGLSVFLFSKTAGASEGADYTFNFDESVTVNSSLQTWSGIDESQQISVTKEETATTTFTTGGLDVLGANETQFLFSGFGSSLSATPPSYWTESLDTGFGTIRQYCAWANGFDIGERGFAEGTISGSATSITISLNATPSYTGLDLETGYAEPYTIIDADTFAIDYGVSGDGYIEMTTVDGAYGSNSPYVRIANWTTHPATGSVARTMNGNLKGLFGAGNEYGFYAGDGAADTNQYLRMSNQGVRFNNIPVVMYTGGETQIKIDASNGIDLNLPTAADTLTAITWRETVGAGSPVVKIDTYAQGGATTLLADVTAIASANNGQIIIRAMNNGGTSEANVTIQSGTSTDTSVIYLTGNEVNVGSVLETSAVNVNLASGGTFTVDGDTVLDGSVRADNGIGIGATISGSWTSSNWTKAVVFASQGTALLWNKGASGVARGIGVSSDGVLYITRSTANDNSAAATYDVTVGTTGGVTMNPAAGTPGLTLTTPANQTSGMLYITAANNGSSYGPHLTIDRNNNGSTPSAGFLYVVSAAGNAYAIWPDAAGNLRIGTTLPTSAQDSSGTVVGTQTSSLDSKVVLGTTCTPDEALQHVLEAASTALRRFRYKSGSFNDQEFEGIVTDYAPRYGMDRDEAHPAGKSLNTIQIVSDLILSIKSLNSRLEALEK